MTLKMKYLIFSIISTLLVPLVFLTVNKLVYTIYKVFFPKRINSIEMNIIILNSYFILVMVAIVTILYGVYFIKKVSNNIINIKDTVQTITYKDTLPHHLEIDSGISKEFNNLSLSINHLIDRLRHQEITLNEYNNQQENYLKQLSHDINTPLTSLKMEIFQLSREYSINDDDTKNLYKKIDYISKLSTQINSKKIDKINDFYTFNRKTNVVPLINNTLQKWRYLFSKKEISINVEILENEIIWVGEALWFERLFDNIISNIYHHSKTKKLNITMSHYIIIEDFGIGYDVYKFNENGSGSAVISEISKLFHIETNIHSSKEGTVYKLIQNKP
ncbi:HAMP domain-containing sensor histidine kinase [Mammaliicoccus sciuri]|uniref:HAMP domain-containing sensor histidine kinase n=1 Tax=Mammaliicoccus sciuri TaxID=1296 RepID=UPI0030CD7C67